MEQGLPAEEFESCAFERLECERLDPVVLTFKDTEFRGCARQVMLGSRSRPRMWANRLRLVGTAAARAHSIHLGGRSSCSSVIMQAAERTCSESAVKSGEVAKTALG